MSVLLIKNDDDNDVKKLPKVGYVYFMKVAFHEALQRYPLSKINGSITILFRIY